MHDAALCIGCPICHNDKTMNDKKNDNDGRERMDTDPSEKQGSGMIAGRQVSDREARDPYLNEKADEIERKTDWDQVVIMAGDEKNHRIGYGYVRYHSETFREIIGTVWTCLSHMQQDHFFNGFLNKYTENDSNGGDGQ
jgi:hypothetical protein